MAQLTWAGRCLTVAPGQTVLDTLLAAGEPVSFSCKTGVCGSCLLQATSGDVPARAQQGLKSAWCEQGYFLACVCEPETDLAVSPAGEGVSVRGRIERVGRLAADVLSVHLVADGAFTFRAGQYLTLRRADGLARSYSIASLPAEGMIELHVRQIPQGRMSGWLAGAVPDGEPVDLIGPSGECFYSRGREDQPLLLVGTGTGLAPLWGILREALEQGHRGPIHLLHGAVRPEGLYLRDELRALAARYAQVEYVASVLEEGPDSLDAVTGRLDRLLQARLPDLTGWRVFLCGDPGIVQSLRKQVFLTGASIRDIHADAFLPSSALARRATVKTCN